MVVKVLREVRGEVRSRRIDVRPADNMSGQK